MGDVGVICELVDDGVEVCGGRAERRDAGMMKRDACLGFARRWGLRICTIEALVDWLEERHGDGREMVNGKV